MRKVIYGGACSLDGFFAGAGGAIDWLHYSKDVQEIMKQSWATADTLLFGRKTFDFAGRQGGGGAAKGTDRKSTRLNSSHIQKSRMPSSA